MMHSQNAHTMSSVRNTEKTRDEVLASVGRGFWAAPSRLSFLTCAAHDLGWEVHRHVCIFLRAVMYRPAYGPPIRGFIFPETSAPQFMYFFEENAEVWSIFI